MCKSRWIAFLGIDSDLNVKEKLMRLEKENKLLREGVSSDRVLEVRDFNMRLTNRKL